MLYICGLKYIATLGMAVINTIRKYSTLAITLIGFSILAFVLADLLSPGGGGGRTQLYVGEINGNSITRQEFEQELDLLVGNYQLSRGEMPNETQMGSLREEAWSSLVYKYAYQDRMENLGLEVSDEELTSMVQGDSIFIHPWIKQQFTNPETQVFDPAFVTQYLAQMGQDRQAQIRWSYFERELKKNRAQTKYEDLLRLSSYVTEEEAKRRYLNQNAKAKVKYVYVPYTNIPDSLVESQITDELLQEILDETPEKYKAQNSRSVEFVAFDIFPTQADTTAFITEMNQLAEDFKTALDDSSFSALQSDNVNPYAYQSPKEVPSFVFNEEGPLEVGNVYGPVLDGADYKIVKLVDIKEDTAVFARASHILFSAREDETQDKKDEARQKALEVLQEIQNGADFAEMAKEHGSDGTASRGGDLGYFQRGEMVAPFANAVFDAPGLGLIPNLVETRFGYHIIDVTAPKTKNTYLMATISRKVEPSEQTRNDILIQADEFRLECRDLEGMTIKTESTSAINLQLAANLDPNTSRLASLTGAREIVRWAFNEAEIGQISEVFEIIDQNKYIVAGLKSSTKDDESSVAIFREQLRPEAIKKLKAQKIMEKLSQDDKSLEEISKEYGAGATFNTAENITLSGTTFGNTGANPRAIGASFGLIPGKRSPIIQDDTGVFILELEVKENAAPISEYSQYVDQEKSGRIARVRTQLDQAIRKSSNIKDERYKYY